MNPALPLHTAPLSTVSVSRSTFVTVFAWFVVIGSLLAIPMSLLALLFIIAGNSSTANSDGFGALLVVGGPFATLVVGIGLLRRWRWAHVGIVALLVVVASGTLASLVRGSSMPHTYTSPDGVLHTELASGGTTPFSAVTLAIASALIAKLLTRSVRAEFRRATAAPIAASRSVAKPAARLDATEPRRTDASTVGLRMGARSDAHGFTFGPSRRSQSRALLVAIAIMLGIGGGLGWLVQRSLAKGETYFPAKRASQQRIVRRADEPATFWLSVGIYATLSTGALGLAAWGVREGLRLRSARASPSVRLRG
jgi:hypothetical protein